jgi:hypothetical protein
MAGAWSCSVVFGFMWIINGPLEFDVWSLVQEQIINIYLYYVRNRRGGRSVVVKELCYKPWRSRVREPMTWINFFSIYLIIPASLGPGVHSASNRNEYQKQRKMFLGSRARPVRTADNLTAICKPTVSVGFLTFHNPTGLYFMLWG